MTQAGKRDRALRCLNDATAPAGAGRMQAALGTGDASRPRDATDRSGHAAPEQPIGEPVSLDPYLNNVGVTSMACFERGAFNVWGNSFSADYLPRGGTVVDGILFELATARCGEADNVRCEGEFVAVRQDRYDWVYVLAAAERRAEDEVALHFTDGSVDFEALRVSDFWAAEAAFGEFKAFESPTMHYPRHAQPNVSAMLWLQRIPITRRLPLCGIHLPRNAAIHLFALTLLPGPGRERRSCGL